MRKAAGGAISSIASGSSDMLTKGRLPERASPVGSDLGPLTRQAAADLGLSENCRVASGLIDAYAGALGVLGGFAQDPAGSTGIWR